MDRELIERQVKQVISYSQNIKYEELNGVEQLIDKWWDNKSEFYYDFGENLIVKSPEKITFELDKDARQRQLNKFIDRIANFYDNEALADFLYENGGDFYNNVLSASYHEIPKGSKIIRSFKFFEKDKNTLRALQDEASMLIQETKINGYLCMSIHPLDFLSSSENTYKWRSCHSLDGDYRAGNLDYMVDSSTVICYLEGEENVKLPNFPDTVKWNSKKWRMLLNVDTHYSLVFAGRQYPFSSMSALEEIRTQFLPQILNCNEQWISEWHNDTKYNWDSGYKFNKPDKIEDDYPWERGPIRQFFPGRVPIIDYHLIKDGNNLHYNDYLESHIYTEPYYCWNVRRFYPATEIHIGKKVKCLRCGKKYIQDSSSMVCDECEAVANNLFFNYCTCCDRRIYPHEYHFEIANGDIVCPECALTQTRVCDRCGRRFYSSEMRRINGIWLCQDCNINKGE